MKAKLGQYFYAPHRDWWGVWVYTHVSETGSCGSFVEDFSTIEEARKFVWEKNGWGQPKTTLKMN